MMPSFDSALIMFRFRMLYLLNDLLIIIQDPYYGREHGLVAKLLMPLFMCYFLNMDSCGDFVFLVLKTHGVVGGMPCQQNVDEIVKATENWSFVKSGNVFGYFSRFSAFVLWKCRGMKCKLKT